MAPSLENLAPDDPSDGPTAAAASLCRARRVQLTAIRRRVLELLIEAGGATSAYDLIRALKQRTGRPIAPPTVYRALEFLMAQGLVKRVECRNAYVARPHPETEDRDALYVCSRCGVTAELADPRIDRLLVAQAMALGFRPSRRVLEIEGTCSRCADATLPQEPS